MKMATCVSTHAHALSNSKVIVITLQEPHALFMSSHFSFSLFQQVYIPYQFLYAKNETVNHGEGHNQRQLSKQPIPKFWYSRTFKRQSVSSLPSLFYHTVHKSFRLAVNGLLSFLLYESFIRYKFLQQILLHSRKKESQS